MKTLRYDLWDAFEELCELSTKETVLDALTIYLGDDTMRRFVENIIGEWDLEEYFRDYEEFAEED